MTGTGVGALGMSILVAYVRFKRMFGLGIREAARLPPCWKMNMADFEEDAQDTERDSCDDALTILSARVVRRKSHRLYRLLEVGSLFQTPARDLIRGLHWLHVPLRYLHGQWSLRSLQ